jgi:hypothetical protein
MACTAFGSRGEELVLEMQHVRVGRHAAESLEHREGEIRCRHLEREALANQSRKFGLVLERVDA